MTPVLLAEFVHKSFFNVQYNKENRSAGWLVIISLSINLLVVFLNNHAAHCITLQTQMENPQLMTSNIFYNIQQDELHTLEDIVGKYSAFYELLQQLLDHRLFIFW